MKRWIHANSSVECGTSVRSWKRLLSAINKELDYGQDPLRDLTDAGDELQEICLEVEDSKGIFTESSARGGEGDIEFYQDDEFVKSIDYRDFVSEVYDVVFESSTKREFKNNYSKYLDKMLSGK